MAIAVSVLLFLICVPWLIYSFSEKDPLGFFLLLVTAACGVLNIVLPLQGILITVGVVTCLYGVASIVLFVFAIKNARGGDGLETLLSTGAFLLMAWVITFAVLQLTIVV